ncbi:kinase-like domain-containing protein [Rhizophagus clarus]|uniref:Kinase-like domain-containing protein n=1 Tax=Rhizophagus clarus TaxID=94130 RepID=A0A8H3R7B4_9GLOM|nr:kinase-like domain-containing protein [Rhizophagus clarus]
MNSLINKIKNGKRSLNNIRKKIIKTSRVKNEICEKCKRIDYTQLSAHSNYEAPRALEWIPYDKFTNIKFVAKGGFGKVYKANWIDGCMDNKWNNKNQNWRRIRQNMFVALKSLNNSKNVTSEFMNEIISHHKIRETFSIIKFYGITQDPKTKDYMMVLDYAKDGSLRDNLSDANTSNWDYKLYYIYCIALGLEHIHDMGLIHRDLHTGNILLGHLVYITDMGLCKPANYKKKSTKTYGIIPYMAPEILRGQDYTKAADIYSFGIIIPRFDIKVPQLIVSLIKRCLDADPINRPTIEEIRKLSCHWLYECTSVVFDEPTEFQKQIKEAIEAKYISTNSMSSTSLGLKTHSGAIYTSRLLNFNKLPDPKNSDDYYVQYDNITNMEYSDSLQINLRSK